ncbi:MAG: GHMP kinase [Flavobacteriaceae bacterium]|nr:GHMP kinase [Flavobacteriaceae bacterium]
MLFKSNGKILLCSEYLVLEGAKAIALPSRLTQDLQVTKCQNKLIEWQSFDENNDLWFEEKFYFSGSDLKYDSKKNKTSEKILILFEYLLKTKNVNDILGNKFLTKLNFKREWGLGTSSTFVNNLAKWAKTDPYKLLFSAFNGSGYDIACCDVKNPILFQKKQNSISIENIIFNPAFIENLYLVYLEKKQNTQTSIINYFNIKSDRKDLIEKVNFITEEIIKCKDLNQFEDLIVEHENIIAHATSQEPIQQSVFPAYSQGKIKSLGAWGGDFILVTSKNNDLSFFKNKGYNTILKLSDLVYIN